MIIKGKARWIKKPDGDSCGISTDNIISGVYKYRCENMEELARHIFEDIAPDFAKTIQPGDLLIAGDNFGCGSSREQAPLVLAAAGVCGVIARSYARIFYRNAFNNGLPLVECDTDPIEEADLLEVDMIAGVLRNVTRNGTTRINPLPDLMRALLEDGGLTAHFKKHGGLKL